MKRIAAAVALTLLWPLIGCAASMAGNTDAPYPRLTVHAEPGVLITSDASAQFDFGQIDTLSHSDVEHSFKLTNKSSQKLVLSTADISCSCTEADFVTDRTGDDATRLLPGESIDVLVSIDLKRLGHPSIDSRVWIYAENYTMPMVCLRVLGSVKPLMICRPQSIDFEQVRFQTSAKRVVTVYFDPRLSRAEVWRLVTCRSSSFQVTPLKDQAPVETISGMTGTRFQISVPQSAPVGSSAACLQCVDDNVPPEVPDAAAMTFVVPLRVQIIGDIAAYPGSIDFGVVSNGEPQKLFSIIKLQGGWNGFLSATSDEKYIQASILRSPATRSKCLEDKACYALLRVNLMGFAPVGAVRSAITLEDMRHERLVLPVTASICHGHE